MGTPRRQAAVDQLDAAVREMNEARSAKDQQQRMDEAIDALALEIRVIFDERRRR